MTTKEIPVTKFRTNCLNILDNLTSGRTIWIVTKHGKPIGEVHPPQEKGKRKVFGCMKGTAVSKGDLTKPINVKWDAMEGKLLNT